MRMEQMRGGGGRRHTWPVGLHPVPLCLDPLRIAPVAVAVTLPLPFPLPLVPVSVDAPVPVPVTLPVPLLAIALPLLPLARIIGIAADPAASVSPTPSRASAYAKPDRPCVGREPERAERLPARPGRGPALHADGRPPEPERLAVATGRRGRGRAAHDDVPVPIADVPLADVAVAAEVALAGEGELAFALALALTVAVAAEGGEAEGLGGASALVGVELGAEDADVLFVLLADFAVLGLEVVEGLADDVELVDLAGDWMLGGRWGGDG